MQLCIFLTLFHESFYDVITFVVWVGANAFYYQLNVNHREVEKYFNIRKIALKKYLIKLDRLNDGY